jgi:hypothetical protein
MYENNRPALMQTTPGITRKRFCRDPLGTEAEMTSGPADMNPFRSAEEREIVEAYKEKERQQVESDVDLMAEEGVSLPFDEPAHDPTEGADPFAFDDVEMGTFELPGFDNIDPFNNEGPRF